MGVWIFDLYVYMCTLGMLGAQGGQNKALDPLKLELWKVVSHYVGPQVLCKSNKCS